ncbi:MAG: UDP-glucose/GDP-mannose dehydrogenase family protein [Alphaproteobacteria bacterium]|nr:UDP-glucose/GDP-mannose dehydrogenase family protein [Alphaproteobacteria bacterium]MBP7759966.1 UDP-glucose/GDP-mannose dehydrogenase family protein [Alphaproteobacteria bacterium]MBP7763320.1 UDP-glucose/GDP-mannose dehydrogenase family protein [Alphaproteobacteria bacterium]MBP7905376.1 UDP-glucose/GDP-mannose dehydrogenase family protein [Alphaproteobacteria bacterium]
MKISVFGLGYVGAVASACLAESGFDVIAIDTDPVKVKCLAEGRSPIIEPGLPEMIKANKENGRLKATLDVREAVLNSDISLICVGTPSNADGSLKLDYVEAVCAQIGAVIKDKPGYHSVVLRSTVVPGTARNIAIPALEKASGKKAGVDFGFGNNPEFLRESTAIYDYFNPPKVVIGSLDKKTADAMVEIYKDIKADQAICTVEVAEGVKYADNAWHAMKVGFANELGNIMKEMGVDSHKVMDIFFLDTKLNISKAYLKPGFAFGGSCLPKDVRAIRACGKAKGVQTHIFDALLEANDEQVRRAVKLIKETGKKKVGMMGLSFKAGTDDLRESPLVTLADLLLKEGYELVIYDPSVFEASQMEGANQKYIREGIPQISKCLVETAGEFLPRAEVIVIGNHGEDYGQIIAKTSAQTPIIDLVRLKNNPVEDRASYTGICW